MRTTLLSQRLLPFAAAVLLAVTFSSCTDETIVYRDRAPFNPPPDAASGFLGYYDATARQTTCGNCHAVEQATWVETRHANAALTLDMTEGAQDFCYSCHAISSNGNAATSPAGYDVVKDSVYRDVQCESCHGPGLTHVEGVGQGNVIRPLAKISQEGEGVCADCHSGNHHPFVEQWKQSLHGNLDAYPQGRAGCQSCHEGRGALTAWGVESNYQERDTGELQQITCAVCHDPHGSTNDHQLRKSITSPDPAQHLCMSCHLRIDTPTGGSSRGSSPHGAQGAVLLGFAGWRPPGFVYDTARIYGTHATTRNPKLCAGCHVGRFEVTDPATGDFVFQSVGHQFEAVPCVDSQGVPTGETECAFTANARNWNTCTTSGCHESAGVAASLYNATKIELQLLSDILWVDSDGDSSIDPFPTDGGYLPRIKLNAPADLNPNDFEITAPDGAEFNAKICGIGLYSQEDGSYGVHNKFLCIALLASSASYLKSIYGFLPAPPANVAAVWNEWSKPVATGGEGQPIIQREAFPVINNR